MLSAAEVQGVGARDATSGPATTNTHAATRWIHPRMTGRPRADAFSSGARSTGWFAVTAGNAGSSAVCCEDGEVRRARCSVLGGSDPLLGELGPVELGVEPFGSK